MLFISFEKLRKLGLRIGLAASEFKNNLEGGRQYRRVQRRGTFGQIIKESEGERGGGEAASDPKDSARRRRNR